MRSFLSVLPMIAGIFAAAVNTVSASPDCSSPTKDISISSKKASASAWGNLRKSEGSLAYESEQMLTSANQQASAQKPPAELCSGGCAPASPPLVVFRSLPNKFLSDYSDAAKCGKLFEQTKAHPFEFHGREFNTLEAFNEWFGQFSQGKGSDGKQLYAKCDGDCSPQYTCTISQKSGKLRVDADVICGPARDKDDNQYQLSASYRWSCSAE